MSPIAPDNSATGSTDPHSGLGTNGGRGMPMLIITLDVGPGDHPQHPLAARGLVLVDVQHFGLAVVEFLQRLLQRCLIGQRRRRPGMGQGGAIGQRSGMPAQPGGAGRLSRGAGLPRPGAFSVASIQKPTKESCCSGPGQLYCAGSGKKYRRYCIEIKAEPAGQPLSGTPKGEYGAISMRNASVLHDDRERSWLVFGNFALIMGLRFERTHGCT